VAGKPHPRRRGYYAGGEVNNDPGPVKNTLGQSIMSGAMMAASAASAAKGLGAGAKDPSPAPPARSNPLVMDADKSSYKGGGKIKHTSGPRIGKDDGLIPAQRGEYVVRKSAVKKLGTPALNQINRGKIPARKGR
jgi:hypothetical protein